MSLNCLNDGPHGPHRIDKGAFGVVSCPGVPGPEGQSRVTGYTKQSADRVELVNAIKDEENNVGDIVDVLEHEDDVDQRMVALARANLQQGFMWLVRAVFQPESRL